MGEEVVVGPLCLHCLKEVRLGTNFIFEGENQVHQDCYPAFEKAKAAPQPPVAVSSSSVGGVEVTTGVTEIPPVPPTPATQPEPEPVPLTPEPEQPAPFPSLTQPDPPQEG